MRGLDIGSEIHLDQRLVARYLDRTVAALANLVEGR